MIQLDTLNEITFLIIICFSFFIFVFTIAMNKESSLLRVLGAAFFIPFCLCSYSFLFIKYMPYIYTYWISEIILSIVFFVIILLRFNKKNYDLIISIIFVMPILLCIIIQKSNILPFYILSHKNQILISLYIIMVNLILLKYKRLQKESFFKANVLLFISAGLSIFQEQSYILEASLIFRFFAYLTFCKYFYKNVYEKLMSKVEEADRLKKKLDKNLNREVRKQLLHYEITKEKLVMKSKTDSLTKAYNKQAIIDIIDDLIKSKKNEKFSILMFDIDNFKSINDIYGHITGDMCIKNLVNIAQNSIREVDFLGRYGGDEFIIVLPALGLKEAMTAAEGLREKVDSISQPKFTISVGIASYPQDGNTVKALISLADKGLYSSKKKGRNTVSYA